MQLKVNDLIIRKYKFDDLDDVYEILSDEEILKYEPYDKVTYDECAVEVYYRTIYNDYFAVELNNKLIGSIFYGKSDVDLLEIGFIFNKKYWKKGYAYKSVSAFLDYKSDKEIYARCYSENIASKRLLEKLGFHLVKEGYINTYVLNR